MKNKPRAVALEMLRAFHALVAGENAESPTDLGDLAVMRGVRKLPQRVKCAMLPWRALEQALRQELAATKSELQDRKVIDRAKGLLMQRQGLSEQAAFEKMRKTAMDKGLKLADVAQRMLDVMELLG